METARPIESEQVKRVDVEKSPRGQGTPKVVPVSREALLPSQLRETVLVIDPASFILTSQKSPSVWDAIGYGSMDN